MTGEDVAARVHAYAWTDRKPGLERTRALLAALGNPEKAPFNFIFHHRIDINPMIKIIFCIR